MPDWHSMFVELVEIGVHTMMSNDELAAAIAVAHRSCTETYGSMTRDTEPMKLMVAHLRALLSVQQARAERFRIQPDSQND